jgi:chromosome segregation ATPase
VQSQWPRSNSFIRQLAILAILVLSSFTLNGCNEEKARSLQAAAIQFRTESLAAIDAIDNLRQRELAPPSRTAVEMRQSFVNRLLNSKSEINAALIDLAIDPYRAPNVAEWDAFITDLKSQYEGFASIFEQLEGGTFVGVGEVRKSAEYAKTLTVQMALLSDAIAANPPILTQYRSRVIIRLRQVRQDYQTIQGKIQAKESSSFSVPETLPQLITRRNELENQTGELMGEWQQIKQEEQKLLETTVTQCTKAVTIGKELIETANRYDDLSLNQLNLSIPRILSAAAGLTGRDYQSVQLKSARIVKDLQTDPFWRTLTQQLLDRANNAAANRTPSSPAKP